MFCASEGHIQQLRLFASDRFILGRHQGGANGIAVRFVPYQLKAARTRGLDRPVHEGPDTAGAVAIIAHGVYEKHHGSLQPLGCVDGHHAHIAGLCVGGVAKHLAVFLGQNRKAVQEMCKAWVAPAVGLEGELDKLP